MKSIFEKLAMCATPEDVDRMLAGNFMAVVPIEPTKGMLKASSRGDARRAGGYYRRMLSAASTEMSDNRTEEGDTKE